MKKELRIGDIVSSTISSIKYGSDDYSTPVKIIGFNDSYNDRRYVVDHCFNIGDNDSNYFTIQSNYGKALDWSVTYGHRRKIILEML